MIEPSHVAMEIKSNIQWLVTRLFTEAVKEGVDSNNKTDIIMDIDVDQCREMIDKNVMPALGKESEKEALKFLEKVDDVNFLLQELTSKDASKV